jgi:parallel beta-helix repeat protein
MKRKVFSILFAVVLALILSLVIALSAVADPATLNVYPLVLSTKNSDSTAEWSTSEFKTGSYSVHLDTGTTTAGDGDEARIVIVMPNGTSLNDIVSISWWEYLVAGYPPHVDVKVDTDGNGTADDALVFEYAYNGESHYTDEAPMPYGALTGAWYQTFSDDGNGPSVINDTASAWLSSGPPGPLGDPGFIYGTLADWKAGTVDGSINGNTAVTALEIEVDNWVVNTEAYVDDIAINGVTYYGRIQDAVDAAISGDTIRVHPGLYEEPAIIINKSLTLESVSGDWSDTIIDDYPDAEIVFAYDFAGVATIDGFTITEGMYGIYIDGLNGGTININNCFIGENGTGIYAYSDLDGDISVSNCIITDNRELATGIYLDNVIGTVEITDSVVGAYYDGETSYEGNSGAGIAIGSIAATGNVTIDNNKIVNNGSDGISVAGGWAVYGQLTITDNIIGAYDYDLASENGYFTGNGSYGIRIDYVEDTGIVNIDGNKIAENEMDGIEFGVGLAVEGAVTINDNIIGAWTQDDGVHSHRYTGNGHKGINVSFMVTSTGSMTITNNKIAENSGTVSNQTGVYIYYTYGNTTISGNYVGSWTETILGELVTYNGNAGPGIMIEHVPDGSLLIQGNNVTGNTDRGIYVADNGTESGQVIIDGNTINDNGTGGDGIYLSDVNDATIINNTITDNWIGLYIGYNSDGNRVEDNVISDNALDGIFIGGDSNEILFNNISGNLGAVGEQVGCGIFLDSGAEGNVINFNNITNNTDTDSYGVFNNNSRETVDAGWNWWGAKSGPTHAGNPGGTGDAVSDNVSYDPWLGASVTGGVRQTVVNGTVDAMDEADTEVIVTGSATVTVANYSGNPGTGFSGNIGKYVDVHIDDPAGVTEIEIRVYYTADEIGDLPESSLRLLWWNGFSWVACSDSGVTYPAGGPTYRGYMWAKIRSDTTPNLAQLTGSVFGCQGAIAVGGGTGTTDTTPPIISNVLQCYGGVTTTTADICWTTNEKSTSQVKYWVTSSMLSPLDTTYVTEHHVQLTSLTPCTTYTYQTMSKDKSGNLTVSKEYTFTTLGEATFTSSDLSISPTEAGAGETITISVQVTNTSSCPGSYTVTLKINDVVEATREMILEAGASEEVTFTTARDEAGTYSVDVNGLEGSFTVQEGVTPPAEEETPPAEEEVTPSATNWALIGGIIAGVVIVGLLIFFVVRRRAAQKL